MTRVRSYHVPADVVMPRPPGVAPSVRAEYVVNPTVIAPDDCSDDDRLLCVCFGPSHLEDSPRAEREMEIVDIYKEFGCTWSVFDRLQGDGALRDNSDLSIHPPFVEHVNGRELIAGDFVYGQTDGRMHLTDLVFLQDRVVRPHLATYACTLSFASRPKRALYWSDVVLTGNVVDAAAARMLRPGARWAIAEVASGRIDVFSP